MKKALRDLEKIILDADVVEDLMKISKDIEIIGHEPADVVAIVARPREEEKEEVAAEQPAAEATAAAGGEKAEEERESETK